MMYRLAVVYFILTGFYSVSPAQCPVIDFQVPNVCTGSPAQIVNNTSASSFQWDFCSGELVLDSINLATDSILPAGVGNYNASRAVFDGAEWFIFAVSNSNALIRVSLGVNPVNGTQTITNLGNPDGGLASPQGIELLREGNNWYALVTNATGNALRRFSFGTSLLNVPTSVAVPLPTGTLNGPRGIAFAYENDSLILLISNTTNNRLRLINFGSSVLNPIEPADTLGISNAVFNGQHELRVIKDCNNWFGVMTSNAGARVYRLQFGSILMDTTCTVDLVATLTGVSLGCSLVREGGRYKSYVVSSGGATSRMHYVDFGSSMANIPVVTQRQYSLTGFRSLNLVSLNSRWVAYSIASTGNVYRFNFNDNCTASPVVSNVQFPAAVSYTSGNNVRVALTAIDMNGNVATSSLPVQFLPSPSANFSVTNKCLNDTIKPVNLSTPSATITGYHWFLGNGDTITGSNIAYAYPDTGIYNIRLTVTASNGCTNSIIKPVQIYELPTPDFTWLNGCSNTPIPFTNSSTFNNLPIVSYIWKFTSVDSSAAVNPSFTFGSGGAKSVQLAAVNTQTCKNTITKLVQVAAAPAAGFTIQNDCAGDTTLFTSNTLIDTPHVVLTYNWTFGDGNIGNGISAQHIYNTNGVYPVALAVVADNGCTDTAIGLATISSPPIASFTVQRGCAGNTTQFSNTSQATGSPILSYRWYFGDGDSSLQQSPQKNYLTAGVYNVTLCAFSGATCNSCISQTIDILPSPTVTFSAPVVCSGSAVNFTPTVAIAAPQQISSYVWKFTLTDSSTIQNPLFQFAGEGTYPVQLTVATDSGCTSSTIQNITVNPKPIAEFTATPSCTGNQVSFQSTSMVNAPAIIQTYLWEFEPGTSASVSNPIYTFQQPATYPVKLLVTSNQGCSDSIVKNSGPLYLDIQSVQNICVNTSLTISQQSNGFSNFEWDFCAGELGLDTVTLNTDSILPAGLGVYNATRMLFDGNQWFLFAVTQNNAMIRATLGNSLNGGILSIENLGNPGGGLSQPQGIDFIREAGNWYALVTNATGNSIRRFSFGNNLLNTPTSAAISLPNGTLNGPRGVAYAYDGDSLIVLVSNTTNNRLRLINFGSSILNSIDALDTVGIVSPVFAGQQTIRVIRDCNQWYGIMTNGTGGRVYKLQFGETLMDTSCTVELLNTFTGSTFGCSLTREGGKYKAFVISSGGATSRIHYLDFGASMANTPIVTQRQYSLTGFRTLNLVTQNSKWVAYTITSAGNSYRFSFIDNCSSNPPTAVGSSAEVRYLTPGNQQIAVVASSTNAVRTYTKNLHVISGPLVNYTVSGLCLGSPTQFTNTTTGVASSYLWNLGNGVTSTQLNPTIQYTSTGTYNTFLTASANGCTDTAFRTIRISELPTANFTAQVDCQRDSAFFTDLSTFDTDTITQWQWNFAGLLNSNIPSPVAFIDTFGVVPVQLIVANSNGCADTSTQSINLKPKPKFSIDVRNTCVGRSMQFANNTTVPGSNTITNHFWELGDGNTAITSNPTHIYPPLVASYQATYTAIVSNGCVDSIQVPVRISTPADVNFAVPQICEKNSMQFIDLSVPTSDSIIRWIWSFGTGDSSNTQNPVYTFASNGSYNVTLTAITPTNCDTSITKTVTVIPSPNILIAADTVCFGNNTTFTNSTTILSPYTINQWNWNFGNNTADTIANPIVQYGQSGSYTARLTAVSNVGCVGSDSITVVVHPKPVANFTPSQVICAQTSNNFLNLSTINFPGAITTTIWDFGDGNTSNLQNPVYAYPNQGEYAVSLIVISNRGCADSIQKTVEVFAPLNADFTVNNRCIGDSTRFTDITPSFSIVSYLWDFGDQSFFSTQANPVHRYLVPGTYNVSLRVENAIGCTDFVSKLIDIVNRPTAAIGSTPACENSPYSPQNNSIAAPGDPIQNFVWTINGTTYTNTTPEVIINASGDFPVSLKVTSQNGCVDSSNAIASVKPLPMADFSFSPLYGEAPLTVNFTNLSQGADSYLWSFGDGSQSSAATPSYTYVDNGEYEIILTAITAFGCTDTQTYRYTVVPTDLDIAVDQVTADLVTQPDGSVRMNGKARISNVGTRIITQYQLYATLGSGGFITETWNGQLLSGQTMIYTFNAGFVKQAPAGDTYICIEAVSVNNGEQETSVNNNSNCNTLNGQIQLVGPSPNPSWGQATLVIVLPKAGDVQIAIADMLGHYVVRPQTFTLPIGRSNYEIPVQLLQAAPYVIQVKYNDETLSRKFVVNR